MPFSWYYVLFFLVVVMFKLRWVESNFYRTMFCIQTNRVQFDHISHGRCNKMPWFINGNRCVNMFHLLVVFCNGFILGLSEHDSHTISLNWNHTQHIDSRRCERLSLFFGSSFCWFFSVLPSKRFRYKWINLDRKRIIFSMTMRLGIQWRRRIIIYYVFVERI